MKDAWWFVRKIIYRIKEKFRNFENIQLKMELSFYLACKYLQTYPDVCTSDSLQFLT